MLKILQIKGHQETDSDLSYISELGVSKYLKKIQDSYKFKECKLSQIYPNTNREILDLLQQMLEFNPYFRPTAKECLQNRIFDEIRVPGLEAAAPFKINIECDRNEYQFDYENMKAK